MNRHFIELEIEGLKEKIAQRMNQIYLRVLNRQTAKSYHIASEVRTLKRQLYRLEQRRGKYYG